MLIGLHGDALHVDSGGRGVLMVQRFLRLKEAPGFFGDNSRIGVPSLVEMKPANLASNCWLLVSLVVRLPWLRRKPAIGKRCIRVWLKIHRPCSNRPVKVWNLE